MFGLSDLFVDELYTAGERVAASLYREVGSGREVQMEQEGVLPASLNGRVATYVCVRYTWEQHQAAHVRRAV